MILQNLFKPLEPLLLKYKRVVMKFLKIITLLILGIAFSNNSNAQCDSLELKAIEVLNADGFVTDGQQYKVFLADDQIAEFYTTLYGNASYRICVISSPKAESVEFILRDIEMTELFSNSVFENTHYWDFNVENTIDCSIEIKLLQEELDSGCAVMLIGFKQ